MIERNELRVIMRSVRSAMDVQNAATAATVSAMSLRIKELEEQVRAIPAGPQGPAGAPGESVKGETGPAGKDAPAVDLVRLAADVAALIPTPRDGRDGNNGIDGKSVDIDAVHAIVHRAVSEAVAAIPKPKDGKDGQIGPAGKDGASIVGPVGPVGPPGAPGPAGESIRGEVGPTGPQGDTGPFGRDGRDGKDIDPEIVRAWVSTEIHKAVSLIPPPAAGRDGLDARGVSDVTVEQSGEDPRVLAFTFTMTDGTKTLKQVRVPFPIYQGTYEQNKGKAFEIGDSITHRGSLWQCLRPTKAAPGESEDWQLAVKRGSDGKSIQGPPGEQGPPGRDLRYQ